MAMEIWPHLSATGERKNNRGEEEGGMFMFPMAVRTFVEISKI